MDIAVRNKLASMKRAFKSRSGWESLWTFLLGFSLPVSVAFQNIVAFGGGAALLGFAVYHRELNWSARHSALAALAILFSFSQLIHDHTFATHTGSMIGIVLFFMLIGESLELSDKQLLQLLLLGLVIGLVIGLGIDRFRRPDYPMWATDGAKYPNESAFLALTAFFLALLQRWKRQLFALPFLIVFIVLTGAKSSIIGLLVGGLVFALLRHGKKVFFATATTGALLLLLLIIVPVKDSTLQQIHLAVDQARVDLWEHGLEIAEHDHWLGRGEIHFNHEEFAHMPDWLPTGNGYWKYIIIPMKPVHGDEYRVPFHNQFMHALVEHGIPGLLLLIAFYAAPLLMMWGNRQSLSPEQAAATAIWTAFCVHSFFELGLYNASAILMGLLAGIGGLFRKAAENKRPAMARENWHA